MKTVLFPLLFAMQHEPFCCIHFEKATSLVKQRFVALLHRFCRFTARATKLGRWCSGALRCSDVPLQSNSHWTCPGDIIQSAAHSYAFDKWKDQPYRIEVWVEKDAMISVLRAICEPLDVSCFPCHGYTSVSELYRAGERLAAFIRHRQKPVVIYLGDHDPSGMDMTRVNRDRLNLFAREPVEVQRIALNMDQIERYDLPPAPVKDTDTRHQSYRDRHGDESWELDALSPQTITGLVRAKVESYIDRTKWRRLKKRESAERSLLKNAAANWGDIAQFLTTK